MSLLPFCEFVFPACPKPAPARQATVPQGFGELGGGGDLGASIMKETQRTAIGDLLQRQHFPPELRYRQPGKRFSKATEVGAAAALDRHLHSNDGHRGHDAGGGAALRRSGKGKDPIHTRLGGCGNTEKA